MADNVAVCPEQIVGVLTAIERLAPINIEAVVIAVQLLVAPIKV